MLVNQTDTALNIRFVNNSQQATGAFAALTGLVGVVLIITLSLAHATYKISIVDILLSIGFLLGGIFIWRTAESQGVIIRKAGSINITKSRLISKKVTVQNIATSDVATVEYRATYKTVDDAQYRDASNIFLVLVDQSKVLLDTQWAHKFTLHGLRLKHTVAEPLINEAENIANFLNVPLIKKDYSNLRPLPH